MTSIFKNVLKFGNTCTTFYDILHVTCPPSSFNKWHDHAIKRVFTIQVNLYSQRAIVVTNYVPIQSNNIDAVPGSASGLGKGGGGGGLNVASRLADVTTGFDVKS